MLYYYRDEHHQDSVVSVPAMKKMFDELGTVASNKKSLNIPMAGDHVLGSPIKSHDVRTVQKEMIEFAKTVLKMPVR
jgi:hypothetical protein